MGSSCVVPFSYSHSKTELNDLTSSSNTNNNQMNIQPQLSFRDSFLKKQSYNNYGSNKKVHNNYIQTIYESQDHRGKTNNVNI